MPHSLRVKIKRLCYKGIITDKDYDRLCKALDNENVLDKIRAAISSIAFDWQEIDGEHESFMVVNLNDALRIIDKYKEENTISEERSEDKCKNCEYYLNPDYTRCHECEAESEVEKNE